MNLLRLFVLLILFVGIGFSYGGVQLSSNDHKPDIIIDSYLGNKKSYYEFVIKNIGKNEAKSVITIIKTDDMILGGPSGGKRILVGDLGVGASKKISVQLTYSGSINLEPFNIYLEIDPDNSIDESNESNDYTYNVIGYETIETKFNAIYNQILNKTDSSTGTLVDSFGLLFDKYVSFNPYIKDIYDNYIQKINNTTTANYNVNQSLVVPKDQSNSINSSISGSKINQEYYISQKNKLQINSIFKTYIDRLNIKYSNDSQKIIIELESLLSRVSNLKILSSDTKSIGVLIYFEEIIRLKISDLK